MNKNDLIIENLIIPSDLVDSIQDTLHIPLFKIKENIILILRDYIYLRQKKFLSYKDFDKANTNAEYEQISNIQLKNLLDNLTQE